MKKITKFGLALVALLSARAAYASGFSLYEASTVSTALGGAVIGKAADASANFYNPATLSDLTNLTVTLGFVTEHPRCRMKVDGRSAGSMDPGFFVLPHFQMAVPLPWDFTFGLGIAPEFGLGTEYNSHWPLAWNSVETTVQGFVLNPNLAYAITDWWSVGAGLRWLYFDFEQYSHPYSPYGELRNHLKGDNDFLSFGWQVGTRVRLFKGFNVGAVYKSPIEASIKGRERTHVHSYNQGAVNQAAQAVVQQYALMGQSLSMAQAQGAVLQQIGAGVSAANGTAKADLTLPQSIALGFNWDITGDWHLGAAFSWTDWSSIDTLTFRLPQGRTPYRMKWRDTYRFSIAPSWDFAEDWTVMASYVYDTDACNSRQESTMLPPGDRHIATVGLAWRCWRGLELALSYGIVFMHGTGMHLRNPDGSVSSMESHRGLSHAAGFSVTYRF